MGNSGGGVSDFAQTLKGGCLDLRRILGGGGSDFAQVFHEPIFSHGYPFFAFRPSAVRF